MPSRDQIAGLTPSKYSKPSTDLKQKSDNSSSKFYSMLFSGSSAFPWQKQLITDREQPRNECVQAANQLARLRFNIGLEKAKRAEMLIKIEETELREANERRLEAEALKRKLNLKDAKNMNQKLHSETIEKHKKQREDFIKEKERVQTSLKSKKEDDANETFRVNQRTQALRDAFEVNKHDY